MGSRADLALPRSSFSGRHGFYPPDPVLLAALVRHPAARFPHLPQGGAVQVAGDGEAGGPLEVAGEGSGVARQSDHPSMITLGDQDSIRYKTTGF